MDTYQYSQQLQLYLSEPGRWRHPDDMFSPDCPTCDVGMTNTGDESDEGTPAHTYIVHICPKCGYTNSYLM